jgi:hypothetical protein
MNQSSFAIQSVMVLFQKYDMLNHLSDRERQTIINELKHIARCGFSDAKSILLNTSLDIEL